MNTAQLAFKIATGLYGLSLGTAFLCSRRPGAIWFFLLPALLANAVAVAWRYWQAWPMLPMYLGPVALPFCLGGLIACNGHAGEGIRVRRTIMALAVMTALAAVCFPKDYYLPFLKSQTPWAHLFFLFGVAGKGCFLVGAAWAMNGLRRGKRPSDDTGSASSLNRSLRWTVWGFAFWTLSMFAGELWSYLGWGTPVVWDDPAITTTMATWFFYICLLHLHLTGTWSARGRGLYAATGALVILGLNCAPEFGPLRWPF